jgi:ribosome maturation factor RimP
LFTRATFFGGITVKGDLGERVREATADLLSGLSLEVVDVQVARERGRTVLRIAVDKGGGVTLDDCAEASELIGHVLERDEVVPGPYILEVMSPGLDRPLKSPEDFRRSTGKRVLVKLRQPFEGKVAYSGILRNADEDSISLDMGDELMGFKYESLAAARLDPELPW